MQYLHPSQGFFELEALQLAPALIGSLLIRKTAAGTVSGAIVETEAYTEDDPASHSYRGCTQRNETMFRHGGFAYVYFIYGMHHCFNVTSGPEGSGQAVLIRAVEPLDGIDIMRENRPGRSDGELCSGPARLCSAFGITMADNGVHLGAGELSILIPYSIDSIDIVTSGRIGISNAREREWRFRSADPRWVSRV